MTGRGPRSCRAGVVLGLLAALLACGGPLGPIPGGRLAGEEIPYPTEGFAAFREQTHVDLELRPARPRSVRTWALVLDGALFVPADFFTPAKRWPEQALADPRVRIRLGDTIVRGRLVRVQDPALVARLRLETARKYEVAPGSWAARIEVWWFRLEPRASVAPDQALEPRASAVPDQASSPATKRRQPSR